MINKKQVILIVAVIFGDYNIYKQNSIGIAAHPFSSDGCVKCIDKINYVHSYNQSFINLFYNITDFCQKYEIEFCSNITDFTGFFNKSPEYICDKLGYCETLDISRYIFDFRHESINKYGNDYNDITNKYLNNLYLYQYYDTIMCLNKSSTTTLNFTKLWQIKLGEPYKNIRLLNIDTKYIDTNYKPFTGSFMKCIDCSPTYITNSGKFIIINENMLKIDTSNYVYYINITSGQVFNRFNITKNNYNFDIQYDSPDCSSVNSPYMCDTLYNGGLFSVEFDVVNTVSTCNTTANGVITSNQCIYNNIQSSSTNKYGINFPKPPPRCATALDMYCHDRTQKEDCLNCLVKNQDKLTTCSIIEEEDWCNKMKEN